MGRRAIRLRILSAAPNFQERNVVFWAGLGRVRVSLVLPVKQRRALVATNPIEE